MEKTIKFKLEEILTIHAILSMLSNKEFKEFQQGYWFSRWFNKPLQKLENEKENIQFGLRALVRKYGEKKEDDSIEYKITETSKNYHKYKIEMAKYLEETVEIKLNYECPKMSHLQEMNYNFTSMEFYAIMPFVEDDIK